MIAGSSRHFERWKRWRLLSMCLLLAWPGHLMPATMEAPLDDREVIEELGRRLSEGSLADAAISFRMSGGSPSERLEVGVDLGSDGDLRWRKLDRMKAIDPQGGREQLEPAATNSLFARVAAGFHTLVPEAEARFAPDSLVGSLTVRLPGGSATRFFLAEPERRGAEGQPVGPAIEEVLGFFDGLVTTK